MLMSKPQTISSDTTLVMEDVVGQPTTTEWVWPPVDHAPSKMQTSGVAQSSIRYPPVLIYLVFIITGRGDNNWGGRSRSDDGPAVSINNGPSSATLTYPFPMRGVSSVPPQCIGWWWWFLSDYLSPGNYSTQRHKILKTRRVRPTIHLHPSPAENVLKRRRDWAWNWGWMDVRKSKRWEQLLLLCENHNAR